MPKDKLLVEEFQYKMKRYDKKDIVKVDCSFCGREIECPKDMAETSEKHMCYECFGNADEIAKGEDLGKVHVDMPMDKMDELLPESMTTILADEVFPDFWKERKGELKEMSKQDLAKEAFGVGAYNAIRQMLHTMKQMDKMKK